MSGKTVRQRTTALPASIATWVQCKVCPVPITSDPVGRAAEVPGVDPKSLPLRHLTDHTFRRPDYSLLPDTEFPYKLDWMYETDYRQQECLTPHQRKTLTALRKRNRKQLRIADSKRYELLRNAARIAVSHPSQAACGETVRVHVDIRSLVAGHNFPTGFTAERQVWISLRVCDPHGRTVFVSGDLDDNHDLRDDHSHAVLAGHESYDRHLFNLQSKFISLTNKGTERSVILSVNRDLSPLTVLRPADGISVAFGRPVGFRIAKGSLRAANDG